MAQAKNGDQVKVHYTGKLNDGTVFDSSEGREPLEFTIGSGRIIPGFENAVIGMKEGDSTTVNISTEDAYGEYNEKLVQVIERTTLPEDLEPEVGQRLEAVRGDGTRLAVQVMEVNDTNVTLDANHPLAGKELIFDIELVKIA
jgi:FKBP-type peptidyl-prolyl cis-trans isomerase 2